MAFKYAFGKRKLYLKGDKEPFKLSRSKIDLFVECPRCFYLDRRLGVGRPQGFPFNLNSAVDLLLKKEFNQHRKAQTPHPYMLENNIKAIPFSHKEMDTWRENFIGAQVIDEKNNLLITGAIDDLWVYTEGEDKDKIIIVDYKATSKDTEVDLDSEWQDGYKRQMEIYQWIFRKLGFEVSETGYFVYANGDRSKDSFNNKLEFKIKVIPYKGKTDWIEKALENIKNCLDDDRIPKEKDTCEYCKYRNNAGKSFKEHLDKHNKGLFSE
jgi:CRISPR/Cas system-associated exonuclease Cas4 (RecB family)